MAEDVNQTVLCSNCFTDEGLRVGAVAMGQRNLELCPNCHSATGSKLNLDSAETLAHEFFTWGTFIRGDFGGAPEIVANKQRTSDVTLAHWSGADLNLLESKLGLGFFLYRPRQWMLGEVFPLKTLRSGENRQAVINRIIGEYPQVEWHPGKTFYRIRNKPNEPAQAAEYDSPPQHLVGNGRLEHPGLSVLYGSEDLQTCIHECRLTVLDDPFVATLTPTKALRLLDLTYLLPEVGASEFESLDMAVHMLFMSASHSYPITRELARHIQIQGLDGLIYPSFFTLARTGSMPFATGMFGVSHRRMAALQGIERFQTVPNVAMFGRPISEGKLRIQCINRLVLAGINYGVILGPVGYEYVENANHSVLPMPPPQGDEETR